MSFGDLQYSIGSRAHNTVLHTQKFAKEINLMLGTLTTKGKQQNKKQSEGWEETFGSDGCLA